MANNEITKWVPKLVGGSASEVTNALKVIGDGNMRGGVANLMQTAFKNGGKGKNALIASTAVLGVGVLVLAGYQIYNCCKSSKKTAVTKKR